MPDSSKDILHFDNLIEGTFIERPNRFLVIADVKGERIKAHLKDPGRLVDLMICGARMLFKSVEGNTKRNTKFDVIAVMQHDGAWILMNSGYHNKMAQCVVERGFIHELIGYDVVHKEYAYDGSRIDFVLEKANRQMLLEVKGSTFIRDGTSYFPDAPTKRGVRHLDELISAKGEGWDAGVLFIVMQPEAREIQAYRDIDPVFADRLKDAHDAGVVLCAGVFGLRDGVVSYMRQIPVRVQFYSNSESFYLIFHIMQRIPQCHGIAHRCLVCGCSFNVQNVYTEALSFAEIEEKRKCVRHYVRHATY